MYIVGQRAEVFGPKLQQGRVGADVEVCCCRGRWGGEDGGSEEEGEDRQDGC
jgi:hypothetical protein